MLIGLKERSKKIKKNLEYTGTSHSTDELVKLFDAEAGFPHAGKVAIVQTWPRIEFPTKHSNISFEKPLTSLLMTINKQLPFRLPESVLKLAGNLGNKAVKKGINAIPFTKGAYQITQVILDVFSGELKRQEYDGFFKLANNANHFEPTPSLNFRETYTLAHQHHYEVKDYDPKYRHLRHASPTLRAFLWKIDEENISVLQTANPTIPKSTWELISAGKLKKGHYVNKKGWILELQSSSITAQSWFNETELALTKYPALKACINKSYATLLTEELQDHSKQISTLQEDIDTLKGQIGAIPLTAEEHIKISKTLKERLLNAYINDESAQFIQGIFGPPFPLGEQYIHLQLACDIHDPKKAQNSFSIADPTSKNEIMTDDYANLFPDQKIKRREPVNLKKHLISLDQLFEKQEIDAREKPNLIFLCGDAGYGKTTSIRFISRQWAEGKLWPKEFLWVFLFTLKNLPKDGNETWDLCDWVYAQYCQGGLETIDKTKFRVFLE